MSTAELPIQIDERRLASYCRAHGIGKLSLFGSVLRDDFDPQRSDIDVLAEFKPGALKGVGFNYVLLGDELSEILGHRVDFCSNLRPWLRDTVQTLTVYEES
jgi:predicted nucleotidyltransferase